MSSIDSIQWRAEQPLLFSMNDATDRDASASALLSWSRPCKADVNLFSQQQKQKLLSNMLIPCCTFAKVAPHH